MLVLTGLKFLILQEITRLGANAHLEELHQAITKSGVVISAFQLDSELRELTKAKMVVFDIDVQPPLFIMTDFGTAKMGEYQKSHR